MDKKDNTAIDGAKMPTSTAIDNADSMSEQQQKPGIIRKICNFLGFEKRYNLPLFVIFAGAMLGFSLARFQYIDIPGKFADGAVPGEWYWYRQGHYRVGITLHLATILPAGFLMVWQFIPKIRHNFIWFHRINGYVIIILVFLSNVGALMIVRRAFGGTMATQTSVGTLVVITTVGLIMGYINIRRLQIDQHRAWMLRSMFYLGTIISERVIMIISAMIVSKIQSYYTMFTCDEVAFIVRDDVSDVTAYMHQNYPACFVTANNTLSSTVIPQNQIAVSANILNDFTESTGAVFRLTFGSSMWIAIFLHVVGVELYLALTIRESHRLRQVSYQKQLEAGLSKPGSSGLVRERFGDANEWVYDPVERRPLISEELEVGTTK